MCVKHLDIDIIGIAETHLIDDKQLDIHGYKWYGNNRKQLHVRARTGSGGVGFLVKTFLLDTFNVSIFDDSNDGILWLKMQHKRNGYTLLPCVCYLPPENSSRQVDVHGYFDNLLADTYQFQDIGLIFICGDFYSRCGDNNDFIQGVDEVCERNVADFKTNYFGNVLLEFLINSNLCLLNGRNFVHNDYTSVSAKGSSVVDYCIVNQDTLSLFSHFNVTRVTDLISQIGDIRAIASSSISDHSVLIWNIQVDALNQEGKDNEPSLRRSYDKFDFSSINDTFLSDSDVFIKVTETIARLEGSFHVQSDTDKAYNDWCRIVQDEMYGTLPVRTVTVGCKAIKNDVSGSRGGAIGLLSCGMRCVKQRESG